MVVQHNMQAINANRQLSVVTGQQAKSTEKLSSGFRINRAADDAAGLSISEKMRRQIRGLTQASTNAQDGVSSVQTAEGALNEVHSMLQRMNELANQASNGTNSQTDREAIQNEIDALNTEIDRVSETTKFNETNLLKGGDGTKKVTMNAHDAGLKGSLVDNKDGTANFTASLKEGEKISIGGKQYKLKADDGKLSTNAKDIASGVSDLKVGDKVFVENGTSHNAYQVESKLSNLFNKNDEGSLFGDNIKFSQSVDAESGAVERSSTGDLGVEGNTIDITYLDDEGVEKTFTMKYDKTMVDGEAGDSAWQKVTGYNDKTGETNLGNIDLIGESEDGNPVNEELSKVLKTATKVVATQARTGEKITFGAQDVIAKDLEDTQVGSKIFMTAKPGTGGAESTIASIYEAVNGTEGKLFDKSILGENSDTKLGESKTVEETSEVTIGDDDSITIHDAKKLMAKELAQANGIGVDDIKDVSAQFRKSGSDIANELALNNGDKVTIKKTDQDGNDKSTVFNIKGDLTFATLTQNASEVKDITEAMKNIYESEDPTGTGVSIEAPSVDTKSRMVIKDAEGNVTELKFGNDGENDAWQRVEDDSTLTISDMKELLKNAVAVDYTADTTKPEIYNDPADENLENSNLTVRWRTAEGMRQEIAGLDSGNKVKVENKDMGDESSYDTGDIEVKNDSGEQVSFDMKLGSTEVAKALNFNLHVGADADLTNKIGVDINVMNTSFLGVRGLDVVGKDANGVNTDDGGKAATYAIDAIEDAIQKVNEQRSSLGAVQNRLEHTIANLDNVVENTTAAESRIRDTDIAKEMVNYSKNNILAQAGQSMLAQANQSTQGALSLLG